MKVKQTKNRYMYNVPLAFLYSKSSEKRSAQALLKTRCFFTGGGDPANIGVAEESWGIASYGESFLTEALEACLFFGVSVW